MFCIDKTNNICYVCVRNQILNITNYDNEIQQKRNNEINAPLYES